MTKDELLEKECFELWKTNALSSRGYLDWYDFILSKLDEEREACANIAENDGGSIQAGCRIAIAIRDRKSKKG